MGGLLTFRQRWHLNMYRTLNSVARRRSGSYKEVTHAALALSYASGRIAPGTCRTAQSHASPAAEVGAKLRYRAPQPGSERVARLCAILVFCCSGLIAIPAGAQVQGPTHPENSQKIEKGKALHAETDITLVPISVTDPYGRLVTGLEQENFRVFEDNSEQEIVRFTSEDVPISIGVIFDMSGSMSDKIEKSRLAA